MVKEGAEEYFLQGSNGKAVLLVHGYTGTPAELRPLGDYLHSLGYTVLGVRLPGHGTNVEDLRQTTADQWYYRAEAACKELLANYSKVFVAGLSMGGLLTLRLGAMLPVEAIAVLAVPIFVQDKRRLFFAILKYFIKDLPKKKRHYKDMDKYNLAYEKMPVQPLGSLFTMIDQVRKLCLPQLKVPCLIMQSKIEHTVDPRSAQYIYDHVASKEKQLYWFNHSGHILSLDHEHDLVFATIGRFFEER